MFASRKPPTKGAPGASTLTLIESADADGGYGMFCRAVRAAGLEEALSAEGPFTVFAPTDAAFGALPEGELEWLFRHENREELVSLIGYHVMTGGKTAAEIGRWDAARTVQGQLVRITEAGGRIALDGAAVRPAAFESRNGYLHGIDRVLHPAPEATAQ